MNIKGYELFSLKDYETLLIEKGGQINLSTLLYDLAVIRERREKEKEDKYAF